MISSLQKNITLDCVKTYIDQERSKDLTSKIISIWAFTVFTLVVVEWVRLGIKKNVRCHDRDAEVSLFTGKIFLFMALIYSLAVTYGFYLTLPRPFSDNYQGLSFCLTNATITN